MTVVQFHDQLAEPCNDVQEPYGAPAKWYSSLKRPEWWLVILGFPTLIFVAWQAWETRRSASAASDNTEAAVKNERAWLLIEEIKLSELSTSPAPTAIPINYAVRVTNYGNTPAFVTNAQCKLETRKLRDASDQPFEGRIYDVEEKRQQRIVPPNGDFWLKPWDTQIFSAAQVDAINCYGAERAFIFVHGVVKYRDAFGREHHTRFNYRYDIAYFSGPAPAGFYLAENPIGFNDWT